MWRFWLGLPLDGYKLATRCLKHLMIGVWWLILPSGVSSFDFPTGHFVTRTVVFYLLSAAFIAPRVVDWMMGMQPAGSENAAMVIVMVVLLLVTAILAMINLVLASELRRVR